MKRRKFVMLVIAAIGCVVTPFAFAAYKCTTKAGVSYQDKPCPEATQPTDPVAGSARDAESARQSQRQPQRTQKEQESERSQARPKLSPVDQRKADGAADHDEWLERAARKADLLKRCASGETRCSATSLRTAALYLSESQLESALGAPGEKLLIGMEGTTAWTVRLNDDGRVHSVKIMASWGLCSDDKNYFASGYGQRACKINVE
jgi:hypothetical protein